MTPARRFRAGPAARLLRDAPRRYSSGPFG